MNPSDEIKQRLLETILVLEEYTPKLQTVDSSLNEFKKLINDQKNLLENNLEENLKQQNSYISNLKSTTTELVNKTRQFKNKSSLLIFSTIILISFVFGSFLSYHYSDKLYFSDHRLKIIKEIETENYNIRTKYLNDIKLFETLREKGCIISEEMLLAPSNIVNQSGSSEDNKYIGVWLK